MRISVEVDESIRKITKNWAHGTISAFIRGCFIALFKRGLSEREVYSFLSGHFPLDLGGEKDGNTKRSGERFAKHRVHEGAPGDSETAIPSEEKG